MDTQNYYEEEIQSEHEFCVSNGIKTEDISRHQRRHFNEKTASDSPPENISRESENDIYLSNEVVARYNDQKQSESRHFHLPSENGSMTRNYPNQDEEEQAAEPRERLFREHCFDNRSDCLSEGMDKHNADPKLSARQLRDQDEDEQYEDEQDEDEQALNQDEDEQAAEPRESERLFREYCSDDRSDCLSEGMDKHNADPKLSARRHYPNQDEDEQAAEPRKSVGRDDCLSEGMDKHNADPKLSARRHYPLITR